MRPSVAILAVLFAGAASTLTLAQKSSTLTPMQKLDAELASIAADPAYPLAGLSVLAIHGGRVVYEGQFGRRRIDAKDPSRERPVDAKTMYRVASISKLVTTLGVMRLMEEGKLALDRDISDYLGFRVRNPHFPDDAITVRMLLTHTSSLRDAGGYFWDARHALRDVLVPGGPLYGEEAMWARNAKPGAWFQYTNFSWGVVGQVMERVTGERFDKLMKRLVLDPLGVVGGFNPADFSKVELENLATLYRKREAEGQERWDSSGPWIAQTDDYASAPPVPRAGDDYVIGTNGTLFGPQGGLRTSAAGLARIMRMLMERGRIDGKVFLRPETVDLMLSRQWTHDAAAGDSEGEYGIHRNYFNAWGLGNQHFLDVSGPNRGDRLVEGGGFTAVGHLGDAWGLAGTFAFNRESRDGIIVLVGGVAIDPLRNPGMYSAFSRHEEKILTAIHRRAIRGIAD